MENSTRHKVSILSGWTGIRAMVTVEQKREGFRIHYF
jgi:hypothetical protein